MNSASYLLGREPFAPGVETLKNLIHATFILRWFILFEYDRMEDRVIELPTVLLSQFTVRSTFEFRLDPLQPEFLSRRFPDVFVKIAERKKALLAVNYQELTCIRLFGEEGPREETPRSARPL